MTEMQSKLLDIFSYFHDFCEKEGLVYFALAGTALGAIRHEGFIPWDDDIDVGMPQKDYERFLSLADKFGESSKYIIEAPSDKKDFVYSFAKVYDTSTTLIESSRYKTKRGLYIDVFPIYGMGNTEEESLSTFKHIDFYVNLYHTRVCALRKGRSFYKNASILLSRCVPQFIINNKKLLNKINTMANKNSYKNCNFVANIYGAYHTKEIMKKEWIGNRKLCDFENIKMYVVEDNHSYLSHLYGDYMTPPPPEKQVSHHEFLHLNLNKSYFD